MFLRSLSLEQFRNHEKRELHFDPKYNITSIVGGNAQGKTNILEAIYLLALTKSFRTNTSRDLIGWGQEYARVKAIFDLSENQKSSEKIELEIFFGNPPHPAKVLKKNTVKVPASEFIGSCQIVFFHPEDLNILYLGPELRRRYLDILNIQINKNYYRALRTYKKVLEQRNALLYEIKTGIAHHKDLEIWDEQLAEQGSFLMMERMKTVAFFQKHLEEWYRKISHGSEKIRVIYQPGLGRQHRLEKGVQTDPILFENFETALSSSKNLDQETLKSHYRELLRKAVLKDIQATFTTIGPHRDDIKFFLHELPLETHASRGEYRSLLLSLKLLELKFFEEKTGQKPLLLLDDVFSELDENRTKMLMESIETYQTMITTTHVYDSGKNSNIVLE